MPSSFTSAIGNQDFMKLQGQITAAVLVKL